MFDRYTEAMTVALRERLPGWLFDWRRDLEREVWREHGGEETGEYSKKLPNPRMRLDLG
jgi:hypothetical protein